MTGGEIAIKILRSGDPSYFTEDRIWYGQLDTQTSYPAIEVSDFSVPVDSKDCTLFSWTVTCLVYAEKQWQISDIIDKCIEALNKKQVTYGKDDLRACKFTEIGPQIYDEEKNMWVRSVDFDLLIQKT